MSNSNDDIGSSRIAKTQTTTTPSSTMNDPQSRHRSSTQSSGVLRNVADMFLESSPPSGMWHATGTTLAQAPTPMEIRRGDFGHSGWDGELQRRNSNISEDAMGRLSRTSSAQTPLSLTKTMTNPLGVHAEAEDEGLPTSKVGSIAATTSGSKASRMLGTTGGQNAALPDHIQDDDDPFSKFLGRGRIESQSYIHKPKTATAATKTATPNENDLEDDDDTDSLDDLDPRPKKRRSALPNKFRDPAGDAVPLPGEKAIKTETVARSSSTTPEAGQGPNADGVYPNGYKFPPKHTWGEATKIGLKAFWKFTLTPLGFLIVIYGLNVVAWGGMLFLLLIGGGKQFMCYVPNQPGVKECNNINAPRRVWIEIDSQILNALFCVTGFGLIPWRFRDLYYLLKYRIRKDQHALRRLAGIHRSWFRLPGSQDLDPTPGSVALDAEHNSAVPIPISKTPDAPLTGFRAPPTKLWKLDYVIWAYVINTFLQAVLSGFMWGLNRYNRPSWSTGLFVALACIVAALGGLMCFLEGKKIKAVEGIPVEEEKVLVDVERQVIEGETEKKV